MAVRPHQRAVEYPAGPGVLVGMDLAVAKVANKQVTTEAPEIVGRHGHAPRGVELAARRDTAQEVAARRIRVDIAKVRPRLLFAGAAFLLGVRDEDRVADRLDVERRELRGDARILESAGPVLQ